MWGSSQLCAAAWGTLAKPISAHNVIILKPRVFIGVGPAASIMEISMLELTIAFIAAFSASIFLAHAVEAYLAR
jgi:hypothetical protein